MNFEKIISFLKKGKYEKRISIARKTYRILHGHEFAHIGKNSYILNPMFLKGMKNCSIGDEVGIWPGARIETINEWHGEHFFPQLVIGNNVNIGQNCHITVANRLVIEDDVVCSGGVMITDIEHITENKEEAVLNQPLEVKPVKVCKGASIGINVAILSGVTIGKHAVVGANSVVTHDVPDYATVAGCPAKTIKSEQQ